MDQIQTYMVLLLLVIVIVINVRPWKPLENAIIPGLFVYLRAIFTAFSTASAPLFKNSTCLSNFPALMPQAFLLIQYMAHTS